MMPIDAYVELGEGCEETLDSLADLGFEVALARILPGCGARGGLWRDLKVIPCSVGAGPGPRALEPVNALLVELGNVDLKELEVYLSRRPNKVRAIVIRFSELRDLSRSGSLDLRALRRLVEVALDRRVPVLVGSGARRPEDLLGARALYSPLAALGVQAKGLKEYRSLLSYLRELVVT